MEEISQYLIFKKKASYFVFINISEDDLYFLISLEYNDLPDDL